jgi:hypothetical protein
MSAQLRKLWITVASGLASLVLGIVLLVHGDAIDQAGLQGSGWMAWGVIFVLIPVLTVAVAIAVAFCKEIAKDTRQYQAWKRTLTPQQRLGVDAAEAAALWAAWGAVHHSVKEDRERSRAAAQARSAAYQAGVQQRQQQQMAADLSRIASQQPPAAAARTQRPAPAGWPAPPSSAHFPNYRPEA